MAIPPESWTNDREVPGIEAGACDCAHREFLALDLQHQLHRAKMAG